MKSHRKKRLINVLLLSALSGAGVLMVLYALNSNLDYFFTPSELLTEEIPSNRRVKVGGMVQKGSVKRDNSTINFTITDYNKTVDVSYIGIVPDLFKEGSGVVVLGYRNNGEVDAEKVLAKHDENYMPPALQDK
jgi:cytochrome c-type biogenesis protein CcmE